MSKTIFQHSNIKPSYSLTKRALNNILYPRDTIILMLLIVGIITTNYIVFGYANYYEFAHFSEIAQNIYRGEGFVSYSAQPASLAYFHELKIDGPPWPVAERFIAYPYFLSWAFAIFGVHDAVVLGFNVGVFVTLVFVLFQVGVYLFDRQTGWLASLIFLLNPMFTVNYALFGFLDPFFALIIWCFSLCLMYLAETNKPLRWSLISGLIYGFGFLIRYSAFTLMPLYILIIFYLAPTKKWRSTLLFFSGYLCAVFFLRGYNLFNFGIPNTYITSSWAMAENVITKTVPWHMYTVFPITETLASHWVEILQKFTANIKHNILQDITRLHNLQLLIPFSIAGFFLSETPRQRRFLVIIGIPLIAQFLIFALSHPELGNNEPWTDRYYFWGSIIFLLFGARGLQIFLGKLKNQRLWFVLFFSLLVASFSFWWHPLAHFDKDTFYARDYLIKTIPKDALVVTNLWHNSVTYYYGIATVELPTEPTVIGDMQEHWNIDYILLNLNTRLPEGWQKLVDSRQLKTPNDWQKFMKNHHLKIFENQYGFTVDQLFVTNQGELHGLALRSTR